MHIINTISRRQFLAATGAITGTALLNPLTGMKAEAANVMAPKASKKLRLAMVGTGIRGTTMWGRDLMKAYPDYMEFVGLCDKNGKEIYDGDIIKITGSNEAKHVAYSDKEAAFGIQYPDGDFFAFAYDVTGVSEACYEVIGNIHDNLELLKGGAK